MNRRFRLSRRAFLSGVGGTAVALPLLEVMTDGKPVEAQATNAAPLRYIVSYAGISIGFQHVDNFVPERTGLGFDLKRALAPLAPVQNEVTLVSGMSIPADTGSGVPVAGRAAGWHDTTKSPLLCGVRSTDDDGRCNGPTSEQLVADAIAGDTRFRTLEYRVQATNYRGPGGHKGRMTYGRASNGDIRARDPVASPRLAFDTLFTGFAANEAEAEARRALLARDHSVLDLVNQRTQRLKARLGRGDQVRLEQHFDQIRELERRLAVIPDLPQGACTELPDPGEDTPASIVDDEQGGNTVQIGYANEEERALVMTDLVHMAIACDLTRSIAFMYTYEQSFMNVEALIPRGLRTDMHQLGHFAGSNNDHADGTAWHVRHWARLIEKLRDTPDGNGSLLDNTALVFLTEGGNQVGPGGSNGNPHSSENMAVMLAGRAGGLTPRGHIVASRDVHPAQCIISAMNAVGVPGGLGEVESSFPGLIG